MYDQKRKKQQSIICYKLSFKRLLFAFILLSMLMYLHFMIISPAKKNNVDFTNQEEIDIPTVWKQPVEENITTDAPSLVNETNGILWFFRNGTIKPTPAKLDLNGKRIAKLWPDEAEPGDDRIVNQLMYVPANYSERSPVKKIFVYPSLDDWAVRGKRIFRSNECPVSRCDITDDIKWASTADAVIFLSPLPYMQNERPPNQVWIMHALESPYHTNAFKINDAINWTATYRRGSDIVTPYARWVYYDDNVKQQPKPLKNYAQNKTHKVAWFVSNCGAKNNRLKYAKRLQKYIDVDIYGQCGLLKCPRVERCFNLLRNKYKFYLAFENSNCFDYITEKFFFNGLEHDILPIVMGARPEDYEISAPKHSYIHVDEFESPQKLAQYLHMLDKDDDLYNSYFLWKGTGEFINTHSLCRICAMLHDNYPVKWNPNINRWWNIQNQCTTGSWNQADL